MSFNTAFQVSVQTPPCRTVNLSGYRIGHHPCAASERAQGATPRLRPACPSFLGPVRAEVLPLWHSLGDHIVISHPDGQSRTLHWRDVNYALKGHNE